MDCMQVLKALLLLLGAHLHFFLVPYLVIALLHSAFFVLNLAYGSLKGSAHGVYVGPLAFLRCKKMSTEYGTRPICQVYTRCNLIRRSTVSESPVSFQNVLRRGQAGLPIRFLMHTLMFCTFVNSTRCCRERSSVSELLLKSSRMLVGRLLRSYVN